MTARRTPSPQMRRSPAEPRSALLAVIHIRLRVVVALGATGPLDRALGATRPDRQRRSRSARSALLAVIPLTQSPAARRMAASLAVADVVAITVALAVIATSLIRGRPTASRSRRTGRLGFNAWRPSRTRSRFLPDIDRGNSIRGDLSSLFGPVDRRVTRIIAVLIVIGVLSFFSAIFFTWYGSPAGSGGGCAYRLMSHAVYTCVSKTAYNLAGAGIQRIATGIFLSFYAMHLYAALASAKAAERAANGPDR
jgi:hypothetical protein